MTISTQIKTAMKNALENLPATSNGTEVQEIVFSGDDAFDAYPTIRIVPQSLERSINQDNRYYDYKVSYMISVYLDMGTETIPDAEVIKTMQELADNIIELLDTTDWLPTISGYECYLVENTTSGTIDTTKSKDGIALYMDIIVPVSYRKSI